jgi:hypothetical protein
MPVRFPMSFIMPSADPGAMVEINLKTGEVVRGMLLSYDDETTTVQPYEPDDTNCQHWSINCHLVGERRIIKRSERGLLINDRYTLMKRHHNGA